MLSGSGGAPANNAGNRILDRVFDGAASQLVASLLQAERISPEELERMQTLIADARKKRTGR